MTQPYIVKSAVPHSRMSSCDTAGKHGMGWKSVRRRLNVGWMSGVRCFLVAVLQLDTRSIALSFERTMKMYEPYMWWPLLSVQSNNNKKIILLPYCRNIHFSHNCVCMLIICPKKLKLQI